MDPYVQSRVFPIHYMDPGLQWIKGGEKDLEIRGNSLVFPIAVSCWIEARPTPDLLSRFLLGFLAPAFFRLGLCPFASRFDTGLDFGL